MMWTTREERIAARTLMPDASDEERVAHLAAKLEMAPDRAAALLVHTRERQAARRASAQAFASFATGVGEDMAWTPVVLQCGIAALMALIGWYLSRHGRGAEALVAAGLCTAMVLAALPNLLKTSARSAPRPAPMPPPEVSRSAQRGPRSSANGPSMA